MNDDEYSRALAAQMLIEWCVVQLLDPRTEPRYYPRFKSIIADAQAERDAITGHTDTV